MSDHRYLVLSTTKIVGGERALTIILTLLISFHQFIPYSIHNKYNRALRVQARHSLLHSLTRSLSLSHSQRSVVQCTSAASPDGPALSGVTQPIASLC